jgi:AraC-like DNA-binding protein
MISRQITVCLTRITGFGREVMVGWTESRIFAAINLYKTDRMMDKTIQRLDAVYQYNDALGVETLHPLVSVIDFSQAQPMRHVRHLLGFYAVFLKEVKCGDLIYGRHYYDYQEGTVVCVAPGQVVGVEDNGEVFQPRGWALVFHPDLVKGTSLGAHMKDYSFFSYESNEALHVSERERGIVVDCFQKIRHELTSAIDRHSKRLITIHIEMLLDYCLRFYERQFITRCNVNRDVLTRFERLLNDYFAEGRGQREGLPTVRLCAGELCLSANYFGDLVKKETGKTAQEYIQLKLVDVAKEHLLDPSKSISQVAYELGFQYPQHFTRLFKKVAGATPNVYRNAAAGER